MLLITPRSHAAADIEAELQLALQKKVALLARLERAAFDRLARIGGSKLSMPTGARPADRWTAKLLARLVDKMHFELSGLTVRYTNWVPHPLTGVRQPFSLTLDVAAVTVRHEERETPPRRIERMEGMVEAFAAGGGGRGWVPGNPGGVGGVRGSSSQGAEVGAACSGTAGEGGAVAAVVARAVAAVKAAAAAAAAAALPPPAGAFMCKQLTIEGVSVCVFSGEPESAPPDTARRGALGGLLSRRPSAAVAGAAAAATPAAIPAATPATHPAASTAATPAPSRRSSVCSFPSEAVVAAPATAEVREGVGGGGRGVGARGGEGAPISEMAPVEELAPVSEPPLLAPPQPVEEPAAPQAAAAKSTQNLARAAALGAYLEEEVRTAHRGAVAQRQELLLPLWLLVDGTATAEPVETSGQVAAAGRAAVAAPSAARRGSLRNIGDAQVPQAKMTVNDISAVDMCAQLGEVRLRVMPQQLAWVSAFVAHIGGAARFDSWRRVAPLPHERPSSHPRLWWQRLFAVVREELRRQRPRFDWSTLLERRDQRRRYVKLYAARLRCARRGGSLGAADRNELSQLDRSLPLEHVLFFRQLAEVSDGAQAARERQSALYRTEQSGSMLDVLGRAWRGVFGEGDALSSADQDADETLSGLTLTEDQRHVIGKLLEESEMVEGFSRRSTIVAACTLSVPRVELLLGDANALAPPLPVARGSSGDPVGDRLVPPLPLWPLPRALFAELTTSAAAHASRLSDELVAVAVARAAGIARIQSPPRGLLPGQGLLERPPFVGEPADEAAEGGTARRGGAPPPIRLKLELSSATAQLHMEAGQSWVTFSLQHLQLVDDGGATAFPLVLAPRAAPHGSSASVGSGGPTVEIDRPNGAEAPSATDGKHGAAHGARRKIPPVLMLRAREFQPDEGLMPLRMGGGRAPCWQVQLVLTPLRALVTDALFKQAVRATELLQPAPEGLARLVEAASSVAEPCGWNGELEPKWRRNLVSSMRQMNMRDGCGLVLRTRRTSVFREGPPPRVAKGHQRRASCR